MVNCWEKSLLFLVKLRKLLQKLTIYHYSVFIFFFGFQEGVTAAELASRLENIAISEKLPFIVKIRVEPPAVSVTSV